jgi:hypothetical protein
MSVKVPIVNREHYTMYLELFEGMLWFHTDIRKWNKEVKKKYLEDLDLLQYLVSVPIVALVANDNIKLAKFGVVTGWNKINRVVFNNIEYDVFTRSK